MGAIEEGVFLEVFRLAALEAGALARHLQGAVRLETKEGERSPEAAALTRVDVAAQEVLLLALRARFSGVAVDAEEQSGSVGLFLQPAPGRPLVVLDPIDGTLNYARGHRDYAVMGAYLEGGVYRAALVHFPARGVTLFARDGGGCWRQDGLDRPEGVRLAAPSPRRVLVSPSVPEAWREALAGAGDEVAVSRCSALDSCAMVLGEAAASVSEHGPDRRRAIGFLVAREAGGVVDLAAGRRWAGEDPRRLPGGSGPRLVAASPERAASLRALLESVRG